METTRLIMVRYALITLTLVLYCTTGWASNPTQTIERVQIDREDITSVSLNFNLADIQKGTATVNGFTHTTQLMPDEGMTTEYGQPVLPAVSRWVIVPPTAGLELVISTGTPRIEPADYPPLYCTDTTMSDAPLALAMAHGSSLYPPQVAVMSEPMIMRGVRMVLVTTFPVQYDTANNTFLHYDNISTEIRFTDELPVNPVDHPARRNRSVEFLKVIQNLAINSEEVGRDDPIDSQESVGHYLVAINANLLQYVSPFVEWRRKSGWKVDIYSVPNGSSVQTIQTEIQNRYNAYINAGSDPFDHVLLVGDRSTHDGCGAPVGYVLQQPGTTDYNYALLEGGDNALDVALSRWAAGSKDLMDLNLGKTLGYEATPRLENPEWFTRGGALSSHWGNSEFQAWNITINTNVRWGSEVLEKMGFKDVVSFEDYTYDQQAARVGPIYRDLLNAGSSLILCRAELYYWRSNANNINNNTVHPIDIATSGHGEWATWWITRTGSANQLIGPVAKTCTWANNQTGPNTALFILMTRGVVMQDMTYGWGRAFTFAAMKNIYGNNLNSDQSLGYFDMYGDPGIQPWCGMPEVVSADYPTAITPNMRTALVHVTDKTDGHDVPGAQVTVYAPGSMPAFNSAEYATYKDMLMWTAKTDSSGLARLVFPEGTQFVANTDMFFTVTGRKIVPFFGKRTIKVQTAPELSSYTVAETAGNNDGKINPGEQWKLSLKAMNVGNAGALAELKATVKSLSRYITVDENVINFGDVGAGEKKDGDISAVLRISPACPDAKSRPDAKPMVLIEFSSGANKWTSAIQLTSLAPNYEVKSVVGGIVVAQDDRNHDLDIELINTGSIATGGDLTATLKSRGFALTVVNRGATYADINVGGTKTIKGAKFTILPSKDAVPGILNDMVLIVRSEAGFVDSAYFTLQIGQPGANKPGGPDPYGYIVFDDTDVDWDVHPAYKWIEISTKENIRDYDGISCNFDGRPDDHYGYNSGQNMVVPLHFQTQFYGYTYDSISICSNGFLCMGDQRKITNYDNWPMDQAIAGGVGMIAAFWDKLKLDPANSNVYYYYDQDSARFIVEWYKLRHYTGANTDLIFEAILYDKDVWKTTAGDTKIFIQYKSIANLVNVGGGQTADQAWVSDNPYASVGVSSPDGDGGLSYTFGNVYPATSAVIQNQRALLFLTVPKVKLGVLYGTVKDVENDEPIEGATVFTTNGQEVKTDENGFYRIGEAVAELGFDVTASALGYNDSTIMDTLIVEDDSIRVDFALLHPLFRSSTKSISAVLDVDMESDYNFSVSNDGNGPLEWRLYRKLPGNADVDPWQRRVSLRISEAIQATRVQGVVFGDDKYIVSAGAKVSNDPNMIWVLSRDMEILDSYPQFGVSRLGMYDLGWDGTLVWGADNNTLYGFTIEGELKKQFIVPIDYVRGVEWDSKRSQLLISGRTTEAPLIGVDRDGRVVNDYGKIRLNRAGIGFWPDDPDGYQAYLFSDREGTLAVHKMNLETKDTVAVATLTAPEGGLPEGCFITNQFDVYSWVFITLINGTDINDRYNDRIDLWQLDARRDWFKVFARGEMENEILSGVIPPGGDKDLTLVLNTRDLPKVPFEGILQFSHNAITVLDSIVVSLTVIGPGGSAPFNILEPADSTAVDLIDSSKVQFSWNRSPDRNWGDHVSYELWMLSGRSKAKVAETADTTTIIDFFTLDYEKLKFELPADSLVSVKWWVTAFSDPDITISDSTRILMVKVPPLPERPSSAEEDLIPVVFGLGGIYPSPFNAITTIRYGADKPEHIRIAAYDISGREVALLANQHNQIGWHKVSWNAGGLSSGVYIIRLEAKGRVQATKIALIK